MSKKIEKEVIGVIESLGVGVEVSLDMDLKQDLRLDSLDIISLLFDIERKTDIKIPEEDIDDFNLFNIRNLVEYLNNKE
jgi:acyl carrier protein